MAGLSVRITSANFSNYIASIDAPSRFGLVGEYFLGVNASQTQDNHVDGQSDGLIVGSGAIYNSWSALLRDSGYLNSQLPSTQEMTVVVLGKKCVNPTQVALLTAGKMVDNYNATPNPDTGFVWASDQNFNTLYGKVGDLGTEFPTAHQAVTLDYPNRTFGDNFAFQHLRLSYANKTAMEGYFNTTSGNNQQTTYPLTNPAFASSASLKIGGGTIGQEMAYVAIYNRLLTDQELNILYAYLRDYYLGKIVVE